uniref:beta-mannosidase n=1 Tax=Gordonia sp. B7-2 TaxID=3420932 RepID=UPI003D92C419
MTTRRGPLLRASVLIGVAVLTAVLMTACSSTSKRTAPESTSTGQRPSRVETTPTGLLLDGKAWWPTGFNAYQLGTDWAVNRGCGAAVDLDSYFGRLPQRSLTRFNLYASFAVDKRTGLLNFAPLDAVFAAAARHGQMVLPVLTSGEGACEDEVFKEHAWYVSGWRTTPSAGNLTYSKWLETAVNRWHGEKTIAGWELVGEPEPSVCGASCDWQQRRCPANAARVLRQFFDDAGAQLRTLDPNRPIFSGLVGGDQCGTAGRDYVTVGRSPGVDVLDFHDYLSAVDESGPHGSNLPARIRQSREIGKPLVVNEIGIKAGSCLKLDARAARFRQLITSQRSDGTAAALLWAFVPDPRTSECTYDIGPIDPAWQVVADTVK